MRFHVFDLAALVSCLMGKRQAELCYLLDDLAFSCRSLLHKWTGIIRTDVRADVGLNVDLAWQQKERHQMIENIYFSLI